MGSGEKISMPVFSPSGAVAAQCLLLHGAGLCGESWSRLAPLLAARGMEVFAPSLPGHGATSGAPLATIAEMADWVEQKILPECAARNSVPKNSVPKNSAAENPATGKPGAKPPLILAGHSMGGLVALALAARLCRAETSMMRLGRAETPVAGLVLMGTAARMAVHPDLRALAMTDPAAAAGLILKWGLPKEGAEDARNFLAPLMMAKEGQAGGGLYAGLKACDDFGESEALAAAVTCPVLLVAGKRDKMTVAGAVESFSSAFTAVRTGCKTLSLDCGHMMMAEVPELLPPHFALFI